MIDEKKGEFEFPAAENIRLASALTKRELFALVALQRIMATAILAGAERRAELAVKEADALLAELNK